MLAKTYVQAFQGNAKSRRFTSRINFAENNEIITASGIQKFSTRVTTNEPSSNNGLKNMKHEKYQITATWTAMYIVVNIFISHIRN